MSFRQNLGIAFVFALIGLTTIHPVYAKNSLIPNWSDSCGSSVDAALLDEGLELGLGTSKLRSVDSQDLNAAAPRKCISIANMNADLSSETGPIGLVVKTTFVDNRDPSTDSVGRYFGTRGQVTLLDDRLRATADLVV